MKIAVSKIKRRWARRTTIASSFPFLWMALLIQTIGLIAIKAACYPFTTLYMHAYDLCSATAELWRTGKEQWK